MYNIEVILSSTDIPQSRIKQQAREHPRFRKICIALAQRIHQVDVRLRLGLLQDTAAFVKAEQAEREAARQAAKKIAEGTAKYPAELSTVSSNKPISPQTAFSHSRPHSHPHPPEPVKQRPRVRPLSESKAVESGANFISEFFLFAVAGGLILAEQIRARRKEASRRDLVAERLELLEDRTRQDEERLAELEERTHHDEERILMLEEENWRLKGGKGTFHAERKERKIIEPTPLWQEASEKGASIWTKILGLTGRAGGRAEGKTGDVPEVTEKALIGPKEEGSPMERRSTTAVVARSPAIIKRIRPTLNPEPLTSDETIVKTPTPSHLSK